MWLKQQTFIFHSSQGQEPESEGAGRLSSWKELLSWLAEGHLHTVCPHGLSAVHVQREKGREERREGWKKVEGGVGRERETEVSSFFMREGPTLKTSSKLITSQRSHLQIPSHQAFRASTYKFWGDTTQSINVLSKKLAQPFVF